MVRSAVVSSISIPCSKSCKRHGRSSSSAARAARIFGGKIPSGICGEAPWGRLLKQALLYNTLFPNIMEYYASFVAKSVFS